MKNTPEGRFELPTSGSAIQRTIHTMLHGQISSETVFCASKCRMQFTKLNKEKEMSLKNYTKGPNLFLKFSIASTGSGSTLFLKAR